MSLVVNGSILPIAQLGPDFLLLRETIDHPPGEAMIVLKVDASERRWTVTLVDGISVEQERVQIA